MIDWKVFNQAANTYYTTDNHLLKLVHDQLPTQKHKSYSANWVSSKCRYCDQPETFEHLMKCSNPRAQTFRQHLPNAVLAHCNKYVVPRIFTSLLVQSLRDWLHDRTPFTDIETPTHFHTVIHSQSTIGWHLLARGFISTEWMRFLEIELTRRTITDEPKKKLDVHNFMSGLLKTMWKSMSEYWSLHCEFVHRKDPSATITPTQELHAKIRRLYTLRNDVLAAHRSQYFPDDLETFLTSSTQHQLRTYILNYEPVIYASIKRSKKLSSTSVLSFGFTRQRVLPSTPWQTTTNVNRETPTHHKHSRWRATDRVVDLFRNFFQPPLNIDTP